MTQASVAAQEVGVLCRAAQGLAKKHWRNWLTRKTAGVPGHNCPVNKFLSLSALASRLLLGGMRVEVGDRGLVVCRQLAKATVLLQ